MMQEEELVMKDDSRYYGINESSSHSSYVQDALPFTISDGIMGKSNKKYYFTSYQIFVTATIMLSTISGGFLEGYTSPALPSLLLKPSVGANFSTDDGFITLSPYMEFTYKDNRHDFIYKDNFSIIESHSKANAAMSFTNKIDAEANKTKDVTRNLEPKANKTTNASSDSPDQIPKKNITEGRNRRDSGTHQEIILNRNVSTNSSYLSTDVEEGYAFLSTSSPEDFFLSSLEPFALFSENYSSLNSSQQNASDDSFTVQKFQISEEEGSWVGSLLLLGAALGSGVSPWIISFGRRHAIILSALPRLLGWILSASSSSLFPFYAGRFLCGISLGLVSTATPIYISEIAHPSLRGSLNCVVILGVNVGIFFASLFGTFLGWRELAIMGCVTVLLYFVPSFFIPNSPSWLISKGREGDARTALRKLRSNGYSVEDELQEIIAVFEKSSSSKSIGWKDLLRERRSVLPLIVVLLVAVVNRFSGYNAIITYCSLFLHEAMPAVSEYWAAVGVCLVQIIATLGAMSLVDTWGRRKLLLFSVSVMGLSLVSIALCKGVVAFRSAGAWLAVLSTMTYVGAYSLGIGPLTWVLLGELFPLDVREKASAVVSVCNWMMAFLVTKTYFSLESSAGLSGTCWIYASVCLMGVGSIFFLVPETKGRTLAEIEAHFTYPQRTWLPSVRKFDQALSSILDQEAPSADSYSTFH